jgi:hypothetical protein
MLYFIGIQSAALLCSRLGCQHHAGHDFILYALIMTEEFAFDLGSLR